MVGLTPENALHVLVILVLAGHHQHDAGEEQDDSHPEERAHDATWYDPVLTVLVVGARRDVMVRERTRHDAVIRVAGIGFTTVRVFIAIAVHLTFLT